MKLDLKSRMKLTVFVGGDERLAHRSLHDAVISVLRENGIAGATVTKGVMSYGFNRRVHSDLNEITMENLPLIIEAVDESEKIESVATRIAEILCEHGLVEIHGTAIVEPASPMKEGSAS